MTPTPHDALFKQVFSDPARAAELLRFSLGPAIAARIEFTGLRNENCSVLDDELRASHVDLLFSASFDTRPCRIYLLAEHQSTSDWTMPLRLLGYMHRIWIRDLTAHPDVRRIPAIFACVLHHSAAGWRVATTFEALVDLPADADEAMWSHVPRFRFALVDIGAAGMDALVVGALSAYVRLTLRVLHEAQDAEDIRAALDSWHELLFEVARDPGGRGALRPIFRYLSLVRSREDHDAIVTTAREIVTNREELMETIADMFIAQGVEKGREELRREMEPRYRKALLTAMRARFGRLSKAVLTRVQEADAATLERWLDRVDSARSLTALLA